MELLSVLTAFDAPEFVSAAVCAQTDPEVFFPEKGCPATDARRVCAGCGVRSLCFEYATDADEEGVWGGATQRERRAVRARRRAAATASAATAEKVA